MLNFPMGPTHLRRGLFFKFGHQLSQMSGSGVLDFVITYVTPGGLAKKKCTGTSHFKHTLYVSVINTPQKHTYHTLQLSKQITRQCGSERGVS